jgi:hypothetical protein
MISISLFLVSNQALGMLHLNTQYEIATSEVQRALYLSAGEALMVNIQGMGWHLSLFLIYLSGLILSLAMLHSGVFNKVTAWSGVLANSFGLLLFPTLLLTPSLIWLPPSLSAPFRVIWYILISVKLIQLAKE